VTFGFAVFQRNSLCLLGLQFNWTYQFLVCADVNILDENISTIKKNKETIRC